MTRNSRVRSILVPQPNRMLRWRDLMEEYGLTYNATYEILHVHGVKFAGGMYIKRDVLEQVLAGKHA